MAVSTCPGLLPCPSSALSTGVRRLFDRSRSGSKNYEFLQAGILNWNRLSQNLPEWTSDTSEYFQRATSSLSSIFITCEEAILNLSEAEFIQQYSNLLRWTGRPELFLECFRHLQENDECKNLLALLLITSALERSLGDVYLLRGSQCPSMLKDLLVTEELQNIFGKTVIQVLRVVIGPPVSLNIRNVAWHGFPATGELPVRFVCFLMILVPSLGKCLEDQGIQPEVIAHRPDVTFPQASAFNNIFPNLSGETLMTISKLFEKTTFVQAEYKPIWEQCLQFYNQGRFGLCLVLLLPQLEHALRRVFAAVNGCPERVLTAETTLYTTFDEILDKYLPSHTENKIKATIGENCMDLLFDLLVYPDGPRIRDRLSHGETTLDCIPQAIVDAVISLAVRLSSLCIDCTDTDGSISQNNLIDKINAKVMGYYSLFHPIPLAKKKVLNLGAVTSEMTTWILYTPDLEPWSPETGVALLTPDNPRRQEIVTLTRQFADALSRSSLCIHFPQNHNIVSYLTPFSDPSPLLDTVVKNHMSTVYRGQPFLQTNNNHDRNSGARSGIKESEIVGLISRIVAEQLEVMSQVKVAMETRQNQLKLKQLRSRQRDNFKRLLESLPCLHVMTSVLCLLTAGLLAHLDHMLSMEQPQLRKLQKFLKSCLQFCENLRTYSSMERNKWSEMVDLSVKQLPKIVSAVDENLFIRHRRPRTPNQYI